MADLPIIFSAPMVRALLAGHKTMTRRLAWREPKKVGVGRSSTTRTSASPWQRVKPGDRLWARESAQLRSVGPRSGELSICYRADRENVSGQVHDHILKSGEKNPYTATVWTPSIHMPRWASRLTLVVAAAKTERLQKISERDAVAEGIMPIGWEFKNFKNDGPNKYSVDVGFGSFAQPTAALVFKMLWEHLHGEDGWGLDPEVVALTFTVHKTNVDKMEKTT